jgi:hypothetical protein
MDERIQGTAEETGGGTKKYLAQERLGSGINLPISPNFFNTNGKAALAHMIFDTMVTTLS